MAAAIPHTPSADNGGDALLQNIAQMRAVENGFDVVIVCTSTLGQELFWQERLEAVRGQVLPRGSTVLVVHEDWAAGGAGNGLGTLYAFQKACAKGRGRTGVGSGSGPGVEAGVGGGAGAAGGLDLLGSLRAGSISVAMFHTAGKGTRLAPLPGSENNNKPGVKLPAQVIVGGGNVPITILEAVIKQCGIYAPSRRGRLSVFWGDQVFVPSVPAHYDATRFHADILASLGPMPSADEWARRGMDKYGLIAVNASGEAAQIEKVTHAAASAMLSGLGQIKAVGVSLGSYSVGTALLEALLGEFAPELRAKQGKLDSDPHFWMPLTLPRDAYTRAMAVKGVEEDLASHHFDRVAAMRLRLEARTATAVHSGTSGILGAVDVGAHKYWWDYGQLKLYRRNNMLLVNPTGVAESDALRLFLGLDHASGGRQRGNVLPGTRFHIDEDSIVVGCSITRSPCVIHGSVLSNVTATNITVSGCILINVTARVINAKRCLLYNVCDGSDDGVQESEESVRADIFGLKRGKITMAANGGSSCAPGCARLIMRSGFAVDGKLSWSKCVKGNTRTFEEVYNLNMDADVLRAQSDMVGAHNLVATLAKQ